MKHAIRWLVVGLITASFLLSACTKAPDSPGKSAPVKVENIQGSDLKRVVLAEKAAERLGIQTASVHVEQVIRKRTVGGEVVVRPMAAVNGEPGSTSNSGEVGAPGGAGIQGIWIRVPMNNSDLNQVNRGQSAHILSLEDENSENRENGLKDLTAMAAEAPGIEDAEEEDADQATLYYVVDSADQSLAVGQGVLVELSLVGSGTKRIVIPYAAVIYDIHGGTWVYTNPEPLVYVRCPILVDYIEGDLAFLSVGPPTGTPVVTVGVAELYGAETGVSK